MPRTRWRNRAAYCHAVVLAATTTTCADPPRTDVVTRPIEIRLEPSSRTSVTGASFRQALDSAVTGLTWRNVPLRDAARQVADTFAVSILRDRRIDPTVPIDLTATGVPLRQVLTNAAEAAGGEMRLVGNVAFLAPPEAAAVIRTLVELRRQELDSVKDRRLSARRLALLRGQTIRWGDLTEPAEALRLVAGRFGLTIENPELVPHDLWSGAILPELSASEALSLLLVQFDLTFAWSDDLESVHLVPLPGNRSSIVIEKRYAIRGSPDIAVEWREKVPGAAITIDGRELVVRGTAEQHEMLRDRSEHNGPQRRPSEPESVPVTRRRFTLKIADVPIEAVMAKLEESGIRFEYDAEELAHSGIDLASPVTIDVNQADADAFFKALFGPLKVAFESSGTVVRLRPEE